MEYGEKMKNVENETQILFYLYYGKKTEKRAKRKTHTISPGICQDTVKNVNNEKYTLQDLDYCQNTINVENETKTQLDPEYAEKH